MYRVTNGLDLSGLPEGEVTAKLAEIFKQDADAIEGFVVVLYRGQETAPIVGSNGSVRQIAQLLSSVLLAIIPPEILAGLQTGPWSAD